MKPTATLVFALAAFFLAHSVPAQFAESHRIMLSSTSLDPSGIYGASGIGTDLPMFAYESYYLKNVFFATPPIVSPNRQVFARFEQNSQGSKLIIRNVSDGSLVREIELVGFNPQWFPNGSDLFYETPPVDGLSDCWSVNVFTGVSRKIVSLPGQYYPPSDPGRGAAILSPDGTKIAYVRYTDTSSTMPGIMTPYIYDIDRYRYDPFFSPRASGKVNDSTYRSVILTSGPAAPMTIRHMSWSKDGRIVLFGSVRYEKKLPNDTAHFWESRQGIITVNRSTREIVLLYTTNNIAVDHPDNFFFSPGGRTVVFNARLGGPNYVFTADAAKANSARPRAKGTIISGFTEKEYWPLNPWSRDGGSVLYQSDDDDALWSVAECAEGSPVMQSGPGQLRVQDAQWVDFSTTPPPFPDIALIDPDTLIGPNGTISSDIGKIAALDLRRVGGIAADGAAKLLIRVKTYKDAPSTVVFSLDTSDCAVGTTGRENEDGSLSLIQEHAPGSRSATVSTQQSGAGNYATVVYNAPLDFVRQGTADAQAVERIVQLSVTIDGLLYRADIRIVRPPVFLVHGVWSHPGMWDVFTPLGTPYNGESEDPRFTVYRADYLDHNSSRVGDIVARRDLHGELYAGVLMQLHEAIGSYGRSKGVAAIRADVVTHSLGGIVTRAMPFFEPEFYFSPKTYGKGRVHKLITMDTPHHGSEYAAFVKHAYDVSTETDKKEMQEWLYEQVNDGKELFPKNPISGGALADLSPGSDRLNALNANAAIDFQPPIHTIVGIASQEQIDANNTRVGLAALLFLEQGFGKGFEYVFGDQRHDLVVSERSQQGEDLFDFPPYRISTFQGVTHSPGFKKELPMVSRESGSVLRVIELLNAKRDTTLFSSNGRQIIVSQEEIQVAKTAPRHSYVPGAPPPQPSGAGVDTGLIFIAPAPGTTYNTGDEIVIEVEPTSGFAPQRVYLALFGTVHEDSVAPYIFNVLVPDDADLGEEALAALAVDTTDRAMRGRVIYPASTAVAISTEASLDSISAGYEPVMRIHPAENRRQMYVRGFYADGVARDISRAPGTTYFSDDAGIAFASEGVAEGISAGATTVIVSHGDVSDSLTIVVESGNNPPTADAGDDARVPTETLVRLDGSGSSDPEGDSLTYTWSLIFTPDGSSAFLSDTATASPSFRTDREGYYVARLRVGDANGGEGIAYVSINASTSSLVNENERDASPALSIDWIAVDPRSNAVEVEFTLPNRENVSLTLFDLLGNAVAEYSKDGMSSGTQVVEILGADIPNGVYICTLAAGGDLVSEKVRVVR